MATKTAIAWTDHTFNIAWGCTKISPGCTNCYAEFFSRRCGHDVWGHQKPRRTFAQKHWMEPLKWNGAAAAKGIRERVFCSSMCDLFEDHPTIDAEREKLWPLIRATPALDWQLLTKRADRIHDHLRVDWGTGYFNAWLGVSVENDDYVERADQLRQIPATVRFISYEPALGPLTKLNLSGIDWVIYGGEGPRFRKHELDWPRQIRDRCLSYGVSFFYKQSSSLLPGRETTLDGEMIQNYPRRRLELPILQPAC